MNEQTVTVRKTYKYKLQPTAEQQQAMAFVVCRCRELYNAGLQERREAWQKCGVSITAASQSAQLPEIKDVRPEYHDVHSQVLQDVLTRLDRAFKAFFRRVKAGETPGYPRFHGANRYNSFTYKQFGNGAMLDNGFLLLSKIGRMAVRWSRPIEGTPKTVTVSREADGWYVCFSGADIVMRPLPATGQSAQLPEIKEVRPEYRDIHSHVLQDVLARLDRAFQAFFRRVKHGETPGYPRFQGANRYTSFTYRTPSSNSATVRCWTTGSWSCRRLAGLPCAGPVPSRARPRRSRSRGKRTAGTSASRVPTCPSSHSPQRGKRPA